MSKKEVVVSGNTDLVSLYGDVAPGAGFENVSAQDIAIPYIRILQALSGEIKDRAKQVPGARIGDIYITAVRQLYPAESGVSVIPCHFVKRYVERAPGVTGTDGYVYTHTDRAVLASAKREGKYDMLPNGNHVVETAVHYVLVVDDDGVATPACLSMSMSQLKKSRAWLAMMGSLRGPMGQVLPSFSHSYKLTTAEERRGQDSWAGWVIGSPSLVKDPELVRLAKKLYMDISGMPAVSVVFDSEV